ncbi:MAG: hypothetical protein JNL67_04280 [Planctomycetaceae bacterium]|nr:hypothetical protein [Planctomycetaceae bacterium]
MNELPEDLEDWPRSPFAILGVDKATSLDDLRRVWLRLVRRFKPDRFPKHFQRLREAYDSVEKVLKHYQQLEDEEDSDDSSEAGSADATPSESTNSDDPKTTHPSTQGLGRLPANRYSQEKPTDWKSAFKHENWALAAEQLAQNSHHWPNQHEFRYGRLLLSLARDKPSEVHAEARLKLIFDLWQGREREQARTWLEWELLHHPKLASSPQWQTFLGSIGARETLASIVQSRWLALGWKSANSVINDVRQIVDGRDPIEQHWYGLLIRSVEYTIWHDDPICREHEVFVKKTVNSEFSWSQAAMLNGLDDCLNMGQQWREEKYRNDNLLLALGPPACTLHPLRFLEHLEVASQMAVESPQEFLERHDCLVRSCRSVVASILRALQALNGIQGGAGAAGRLCDPKLVQAFLGTYGLKPYRKIRVPLLKYCQTFGLSVQVFANALDSLPLLNRKDESGTWSFMINSDLTLLLLEGLISVKNASASE